MRASPSRAALALYGWNAVLFALDAAALAR